MLRARGATALAPGARAAVHAYRGEYVTRLRERGVPLPDGIEHLFQHDLHAGCMETAMMLAIAPDLVSPDYQKVPDLFAKDRWWLRGLSRFILGVARLLPLDQLTKDSLAIGTHVGAVDLSWIIGGRGAGYHGAPARATEALGEGLLGVVSEDLARAIEEVFLEGADPEAYRSAAYLFNWFKNIVFAVVVIVFALVMMSVT
ncbi:MAG: creatininase family protein [Deltaproteobacteria bacterium]|nr:creatininase family protein [Deltaproteobacteria bacterium]